MPQNTKVELTRELIKALLNESRQNAITPAQLAAIYKRIIDIVDVVICFEFIIFALSITARYC